MSKKYLLAMLRQIVGEDAGQVYDEVYRINVRLVTSFEADLLADCLKVMRNIAVEVLGNRVYIPIDETGRTLRAHNHDPEPRP